MSLTENKLIASKCFAALNRICATSATDSPAIDEVLSPMWVNTITKWAYDLRQHWSDYRIEATEMLAEGNMVWCRVLSSATHIGVWEGIPANNRHWTNAGIWYFTIVDNKIVDIEWLYDNLHLIQQLGAAVVAR